MNHPTTDDDEARTRSFWQRWGRVVLLALLLVAGVVAVELAGLRAYASQDGIRRLIVGAGAWGVAIYLGAFAGGVLLQLPSIAFLAAARIAWGPFMGCVIGYGGALLGVLLAFVVVRIVGGTPLGEVRHPRVRKLLAKVDERPFLTVLLLRTFLSVSAPLNVALALSPMKFRTYAAASTAGLVVPVCVVVLASGWVLSWF